MYSRIFLNPNVFFKISFFFPMIHVQLSPVKLQSLIYSTKKLKKLNQRNEIEG